MKVLQCIAVYQRKIFSHEPYSPPIIKSEIVEMELSEFPQDDAQKIVFESRLCAGGKHSTYSATTGSIKPAKIVLIALSIIPT